MEPILNKDEIANLLDAIRNGTVPLDLDEDGPQTPNLASSSIDLFNLANADKEQFRIPNFDIILDVFCRNYATSLTNKLQRTFSITRTSLESFEFENFFMNKSNQGAIGIIEMSPLKHGALVIINPQLSFALVEIMLGASTELEALELDRSLTTIELNILKTLFREACKDIDSAFSQLIELNSTLLKLENNARLVSIVEPEAEVIVGTFHVKVGDLSGEIHLVFPFATLEPLRESLKDFLNISTVGTGNWLDIISDAVLEVPTTVTAQSGTITLSVSQLLDINKGDVLNIDYNPNNPLNVLIEDQIKFSAVPGTHNGKKAISLTGIYK